MTIGKKGREPEAGKQKALGKKQSETRKGKLQMAKSLPSAQRRVEAARWGRVCKPRTPDPGFSTRRHGYTYGLTEKNNEKMNLYLQAGFVYSFVESKKLRQNQGLSFWCILVTNRDKNVRKGAKSVQKVAEKWPFLRSDFIKTCRAATSVSRLDISRRLSAVRPSVR